jgi:hypothetical protein
MEIIDAWFVKNYTVKDIIGYMENYKLSVTKNNYEQIKKGLDEKFIALEKYIRRFRSQFKVQFFLAGELKTIKEKENVRIEQNDRCKKISIELNTKSENISKKAVIRVEKPVKSIQVIKKSDNSKFEFISLEKKIELGKVDVEPVIRNNVEEVISINAAGMTNETNCVIAELAELKKTEYDLKDAVSNDSLESKIGRGIGESQYPKEKKAIKLGDYCKMTVSERNLEVEVKLDNEKIISPPILTKTEQGYKLESQSEIYRNIYLKKDEDDPVMMIPKEFAYVKKEATEEEKLEEKCCHGDAMGNLSSESNDSKMLGGDRSLKNFLVEAKEEVEQATRKREAFQENKEKIETFYKTNIENLLENRNKLADAREKFRLKRIEYLGNKELLFEMAPSSGI